MDRRAVLAGGLGALSLPGLALASRPFFGGAGPRLGINLYMLAAQWAKDVDGTLAAVAQIGFREIETSLDHHSAQEIRAGLDRAGLGCANIGILPKAWRGGPSLETDIGTLAAAVHTIGATYLTCTLFPLPDGVEMRPAAGESVEAMLARIAALPTADDWKRTADYLNQKGRALRREGVRFAYHNHNPEFAPHGETNGLAILLEHTDPKFVDFQMDAGWVVAAGHDPVELLRAYPDRFRLMHVKDVAPGNHANTSFSVATTAVGSGVIDWPRVLHAAVSSGVQHFAIEQEPPYTTPPIEAARQSFAYLSRLPV